MGIELRIGIGQLSANLNINSTEYTLIRLNNLLQEADSDFSFWGTRLIRYREEAIAFSDIEKKVVKAAAACLKDGSSLSEIDRLAWVKVSKTISFLYRKSDLAAKKKHFITRCLIAFRRSFFSHRSNFENGTIKNYFSCYKKEDLKLHRLTADENIKIPERKVTSEESLISAAEFQKNNYADQLINIIYQNMSDYSDSLYGSWAPIKSYLETEDFKANPKTWLVIQMLKLRTQGDKLEYDVRVLLLYRGDMIRSMEDNSFLLGVLSDYLLKENQEKESLANGVKVKDIMTVLAFSLNSALFKNNLAKVLKKLKGFKLENKTQLENRSQMEALRGIEAEIRGVIVSVYDQACNLEEYHS